MSFQRLRPCRLRSMTLALLAALVASAPHPATAAPEDYSTKRISFRLQGEVKQLVITLGTNPAADIPLPAMDPDSIAAYRAEVLAAADDNEPNIKIIVPFVDYGYAGTIDNAHISQGPGVSFDPASLHSPQGIRHTGRLTVTEFSEDVLRASFSARLFTIGENNQAVPVRDISDSFWISFPVLHDPRADDEYTETEDIRIKLALMWDLLRNMGFGLDDAEALAASDGLSGAPWAGGGPGGSTASGVSVGPECVCDCDVLIALPADDPCIQPAGACYQGLQICREFGLDKTTATAGEDVEAIVDRILGENAPETTRSVMRAAVLNMPPEDRAEMLQGFQQADAMSSGHSAPRSPEREQLERALTEPGPPTDAGQVAVNPDWDAETLRYKSAVEQLGLPPDIVEDTVEMFHQNGAPMRAQLWRNIEAQLAIKRGDVN